MSAVTRNCFLFGLVGLLFVGISIPLIQGHVPPNRYYGFRTPKTLSDPVIWYEVNRASGRDLLLAGLFITFCSTTMMFLAQSWQAERVVITLLSVTVLCVVGATFHGLRLLRRY